jgi:hypothetical protein
MLLEHGTALHLLIFEFDDVRFARYELRNRFSQLLNPELDFAVLKLARN